MADTTPQERLQPCLLDRLTDDDPQSKNESREKRVISLSKYKRGVLRDLSWLLNTSCHSSDGLLDDFSEAARSVLNFGVPDLCGLTASSIKAHELESHITQALQTFEPRITQHSLNIQVRLDPDEVGHNAITFEIKAELWAQPMSDSLYIKTEIDLETGQCDLEG